MDSKTTLTGLVATTPRHLITADGLPITSFRLASTSQIEDPTSGTLIDGETSWFTITMFNQLAINAAGSVNKGERVVVSGKLRVRDWDNGERAGTSVEVEAEAIGHDLALGTAVYTRTAFVGRPLGSPEPEPEPDLIDLN
jgi:single-strand DNA-binding protein